MTISHTVAGTGPPVLLLHGFPETRAMWRDIEPLLAATWTVVAVDLPGYGRSPAVAGRSSKRAMAADLVDMMSALGFAEFAVAGHDRGARVAYRMALDHPHRVRRLAALDIVPTALVWERADARVTLSFWPWSLLAQPAPLPETMLAAAADAIVEDALSQWGSPPTAFPAEVRAAYAEQLRTPHGICEEYRSAATTDREHDEADLAAGRRISCPTLVLWSRGSGLDQWYADAGGPLGIWRQWCSDVRGEAVDGGHFFPEVFPAATAGRLRSFLAGDAPNEADTVVLPDR
jgi:haloacetate dehalogenase